LRRNRLAALGALLLAAAAIVAVALLTTSGSTPPPSQPAGEPFRSALAPVPKNHVGSAAGLGKLRLDGNDAAVTVEASGLVDEAHLQHIHAGKLGTCPPASAAGRHNGHPAISALDGGPFYGPPRTALTETGDTSRDSIVDFPRFPAGSDIDYARTIKLDPEVAQLVRKGNAVLVVHGIDYDHDGTYGNVIDKSDLPGATGRTGESTAPALCGPLHRQAQASRGTTRVYTATLRPQVPAATWICRLDPDPPTAGAAAL
jgi:hypothetical protein